MAKLPGSTVPDAVGGADVVSKDYGDANYGGSGPLAAAQGDYLLAGMTLEHASVVGQPIEYDVSASSRGELALDVVNFKVTGLKAGRTYHLQAQARSRIDYFTAQFYDLTASNFVGRRAVYLKDNSNVNSSGMPVASYIFTPAVDTEIEFRVDSINSGSALANADGSWLSVIEIGAVQADVVGGLEFMDIIDVTADTDEVTFGETGDGLYQRALDGDLDEEYVCSYYLPPPGVGSFTYTIRPNGQTANCNSAFNYGGTSTGGGVQVGTLNLADQFNSRENRGNFTFFAKTGIPRFYENVTAISPPGGGSGDIHNWSSSGTWHETVTNLTSLAIGASIGGNLIKIGARLILWRRTRSNLRADSAAVYERMSMETVDPSALVTTERTVGHSIYGGSLVGVSLRVEDAVTAGDITVNVKLDGVTALTAVLDTTNSTSVIVRAAIGIHEFAADKNISVEFVPTSYDNGGSIASAVTAQIHLTNNALINITGTLTQQSNVYLKAQTVAPHDLGTANGAIAINGVLSNTFDLEADGAAVIGAPTDLENGQTIVLRVRQDVTGSRAVTFNAVWDFGEDPTPDTSGDAGGSLMVVSGTTDGTNIFCSAKKGFTNT